MPRLLSHAVAPLSRRFVAPRLVRAAACALLLSSAACGGGGGSGSASKDAHGVWRSVGYGYLLDNTGPAPVFYERSASSCIPSPSVYGPTGFARAELTGGDRLVVSFALDVAPVTFERLDALPDACRGGGTPTVASAAYVDDPVLSLSVLCDTFDAEYAFFPERNPGFAAQCAQAKAVLAAAPAPEKAGKLEELTKQLLASLDDAHVTLYVSEKEQLRTAAPVRIEEALQAEFDAQHEAATYAEYASAQVARFEEIRGGYVSGLLKGAAGGLVRWGRIGERAGYVIVDGLADERRPDTEAGQVAWIAGAFDRALADLGALPGLVIDLRMNGGGHDAVALAIAGRLTAAAYPAFTVAARSGDGFTPATTVDVVPAGSAAYRGRVVVLTSELTASAAEALALALMGRPDTTRVGEATAGAFSDMLPRMLPNGWVVSLSNERYAAMDGTCYEAKGIPPDVQVEFLARADRDAGRDPALEAALAALR